MNSMKKNLLAIGSFVLVSSVLLLLTLRGEWGNPTPSMIIEQSDEGGSAFESSMMRGRFVQTMSLVENGTPFLSFDLAEAALPDVGVFNNKAYPLFAPGLAYYSIPAYVLGFQFNASVLGVLLFNALASIIAGILIIVILREIGSVYWAAWFAGFAYLFGTTAFPYSVAFGQHSFTSVFLLTILYAALKGPQKSIFYWFGWLAYGLAVFMDYPNVVLLMPAIIFMALQSVEIKESKLFTRINIQLAICYSLSLLVITILFHGYYNLQHFQSISTIGPSVYTRAETKPELRELLAQDNSYTLVVPSNVAKSLFSWERLANGLYILLTSEGRGIIFFAPVVLLGLLGLIHMLYTPFIRLGVTIFITCLVFLLLYGSFGDPWGGWSYGPRYLIPIMSILGLGLGLSLHTFKSIIFRICVLLMFAYGLVINLTGVLTTNQLPADIEAKTLGLDYTYFYNFDLLTEGMNSSFLYQQIFNHFISTQHYFVMIYSLGLTIAAVTVLIIPLINKAREE